MSRLIAAPRRIEFVHLRTNSSLPVAPHLASRRRSYLRLRSCGIPPTRSFTVLMWRPHGRTHSRARGNPGLLRRISLDTRFRGYDGTRAGLFVLIPKGVFSKGTPVKIRILVLTFVIFI